MKRKWMKSTLRQVVQWMGWGLWILFLSVPLVKAQEKAGPVGRETVEVRLVLIPFHVVDADGRPVLDLKPEEVEITLGHSSVHPDYLDRYRYFPRDLSSDRIRRGDETSGPITVPMLGRHIYILIDTFFSQRRSFFQARTFLKSIAPYFTEKDSVYFLVLHRFKGIRLIAGPLVGPDEVADYVENRMQADHYFRAVRDRAFEERLSYPGVRDPLLTMDHVLFNATQPVDELVELASYLGSIPGPKSLILVSQGFMIRDAISVLVRRKYDMAWRALAASGVTVFFLNPTRREDSLARAESGTNTLADFKTAGTGVYLREGEPQQLGRAVGAWLGAYYEAGVRLQIPMKSSRFHNIQIKVTRPGVRVLTVRGVEVYDRLTEQPEQRLKYRIFHYILTGDISGVVVSHRSLPAHWLKREGSERKLKLPSNLKGPFVLACWRDVDEAGRIQGFKMKKFDRPDGPRLEKDRECLLLDGKGNGWSIYKEMKAGA